MTLNGRNLTLVEIKKVLQNPPETLEWRSTHTTSSKM